MEKPLVTIVCKTYNHEKYIRDAIDSFLMQKTEFPVEVIIHDDASTDGTADIIREYEKKYPDIIKPIYQTENQYSKKIKVNTLYIYPKAQGKYIAFCEGDDYWISPQKLQKQVEYMESHPECSWCVHNAVVVNVNKEVLSTISPTKEDRIISTDEVIRGGGGFCATNAIFTRKELLLSRPAYFDIYALDLVLQMYLASSGTTFCFAEELSAYRTGVENSWMYRAKRDKNMYLEHAEKSILVREAFDEYTNYKYHSAVEDMINTVRVNICEATNDYSKLPLSVFIKTLANCTPKEGLKRILRRFFPGLLK